MEYLHKDDFDNAVNAIWKQENPIPDIYPRYTNFTKLNEDLETLKIQMCKDTNNTVLHYLYNLYVHQDHTDIMVHIKHKLVDLFSCKSKEELVSHLLKEVVKGTYILFHVSHSGTERNPLFQIPNFSISGLSVHDKSNYEDTKGFKIPFLEMVSKQLSLFGITDDSKFIWDLESKLATYHYAKSEKRKALKTYHPSTMYAIKEKMSPYFDEISNIFPQEYHDITLNNHHILDGLKEVFDTYTLEQLTLWYSWKYIQKYASYTTNEVYQNNFDFYSKHMNGIQTPKSLEKRGAVLLESYLEDIFTEKYLQHHAEPNLQEEFTDFVSKIKDALRFKMENATWMCENTRVKALDKLDSMTLKVVGPTKFKNYNSILHTNYNNFLEFVDAYYEWDWKVLEVEEKMYQLRDPETWLMSAMTINAYYHPLYNEIVFPAGILQAPFYSTAQTFAQNAGGIGAVIAHEMTHGFDDEGSKFDKNGYLYNWWSKETRFGYELIISQMESHFNTITHEDMSMNGKLTQGENLADLGGLQTALYACKTSEEKRECMISWAKIWRANVRREYAQQMIELDPHSPPRLRINAILQHIDDFYRIFNVIEGDGMYLEPERRCILWSET